MTTAVKATGVPVQHVSFVTRCTQGLRNLVTSICNLVKGFFQLICPCLFSSKPASKPMAKVTVITHPQPTAPPTAPPTSTKPVVPPAVVPPHTPAPAPAPTASPVAAKAAAPVGNNTPDAAVREKGKGVFAAAAKAAGDRPSKAATPPADPTAEAGARVAGNDAAALAALEKAKEADKKAAATLHTVADAAAAGQLPPSVALDTAAAAALKALDADAAAVTALQQAPVGGDALAAAAALNAAPPKAVAAVVSAVASAAAGVASLFTGKTPPDPTAGKPAPVVAAHDAAAAAAAQAAKEKEQSAVGADREVVRAAKTAAQARATAQAKAAEAASAAAVAEAAFQEGLSPSVVHRAAGKAIGASAAAQDAAAAAAAARAKAAEAERAAQAAAAEETPPTSPGSPETIATPAQAAQTIALVRRLSKMGTPGKGVIASALAAGVPAPSVQDLTIQASAPLTPAELVAGFCIAVVSIDAMSEVISRGETVDQETVDLGIREGISWYRKCSEGSEGAVKIPYGEVLRNLEKFQPVSLEADQPPKIITNYLQRLTKGLRDAAKEKPYLGAVLFEGQLSKNPRFYGLIVQTKEKGGAVFHLINPYGTGKKDAIPFYRSFSTMARFNSFFTAQGVEYSMMALEPKPLEEATARD